MECEIDRDKESLVELLLLGDPLVDTEVDLVGEKVFDNVDEPL